MAFATHAKVSFKSFESWTKNIDWEIQVPDEEMVKRILFTFLLHLVKLAVV